MIKSVGYAYPTSVLAQKLGAYREGCYYVETKRSETTVKARTTEGPFISLDAAKTFAETLAMPYSRYSR